MNRICQELFRIMKSGSFKVVIAIALLLCMQFSALCQTFEFPSTLFVDTLSLKKIMRSPGSDTFKVQQDQFDNMSNATNGPNFTIKSVLSVASLVVDVKSTEVGKKRSFTYMITYKTIGRKFKNDTLSVSKLDTLSVSYAGDSLKMINDKSFKIAGRYSQLSIAIFDVYEITTSSSGLVYTQLVQGVDTNVANFVYVLGEIFLQKYITYPSLSMAGVNSVNNISTDGTVLVEWDALSYVAPAGYEVEWTYVNPYGDNKYDFRNNATRIFTNKTSFRIPVAEKHGHLVFRVRMVRPDLNNLLARNYGQWSISSDQGDVSSVSSYAVQILQGKNDSLNWDLKMSFVEDGKYKQVITYYDGLLKPKQVQTRFNSNPSQTIVAQSLYDYEGRAVINSLPIPVTGYTKFGYIDNFLRPTLSKKEYTKDMYDTLPNPNICPLKETAVLPLDTGALSNKYYSYLNVNKSGKNAFIPDAGGYPFVRKVLSPENNEKVLFEGKAGSELQLGNDRQMEYLYGSPIQAELNKYFGQDVGKANYYRKLITTDNHDQDMFTITDNEGKTIASGLISVPDTNSLALSIRNMPANKSFYSNLLPIPNIRIEENWYNTGSYFVERNMNANVKYEISYKPFKPCYNTSVGLKPKVYFHYDFINSCGDVIASRDSVLGGVGITSSSLLVDSNTKSFQFTRGNYVWNKYSYIKIEDLNASVDEYLDNNFGCYSTYDSFFKQAFVQANFPCVSNYDPCNAMRFRMLKEMYPNAKYGKYSHSDSNMLFTGPKPNSIFTKFTFPDIYYYQAPCIRDTVMFRNKAYLLKSLSPNDLINVFNDSIAAALLPLHPDYCKLQICNILNNQYDKYLSSITKAADAISGQRFTLNEIVTNDPLYLNGLLTANELSKTLTDSFSVDSVAYKQIICGSELGIIESVCKNIFDTSRPQDILYYPNEVKDAYYQNLVNNYNKNRQNRLAVYLESYAGSCPPCASIRLVDSSVGPLITSSNDTTILVETIDSTTHNLQQPVGSFGNYFDPVAKNSITADSLAILRSADNSIYCKDVVNRIVETLSSCDVSTAVLSALRDTLKNRFCASGRSITSLSYDSLTTIMGQVGIATTDICNAGLVDIRKLTRMSNDFVQLGVLPYPPRYYQDLKAFIDSNLILDFIASKDDTLSLRLKLCNTYPFQQNLAKQLGANVPSTSCAASYVVFLVKSLMPSSNTVKLSFVKNSNKVDYFMYPSKALEYNALNNSFGHGIITNYSDLEITSLFNAHGFDKVSKSFANRNSVALSFNGVKNSVPGKFFYFLSAFNQASDYNMMEKDQSAYLNGVGCSELLPMINSVLVKANQLNIKLGHPYFEKYLTNVINYENEINFDYKSYYGALESCGFSDSSIIKKHLAHFRIKFPSGASIGNVQSYIDTLSKIDTFGIGMSDIIAYKVGGLQYLLLNIYETNNKNIKEAKQKVLSFVPSGSVVEYLPALSKDTIAQLFVYDVEVSNFSQFVSDLSSTFPAATTNYVYADFEHIIPGFGKYPFKGVCITISRSISDNYQYNHYVDSIQKYVRSVAPMTTIFTHAEAAVSSQYAEWQMTAWRNYIMSVTPANHNEHIKQSKVDSIKVRSAMVNGFSFSSSALSYTSTANPSYLNNLYIDHSPTSNTNFSYIKQLLEDLEAYNYSSTGYAKKSIFIPITIANSYIPSLRAFNTETRPYLCGDTTQFWINHFDANKKMINVFIQLPSYLPLPRDAYRLVSITKGFEKDSVSYLNITFAGQGNGSKDTIKCIGYTNRNLGELYTIPNAFLSSNSNFETLSGKFQNCETRKLDALRPIATIKYMHYRDSIKDEIVSRFKQHIIDSLKENLSISGSDIKHGVTLYYYDMVGNLVMTVPPAGVDELDVTDPNNSNINTARSNLYNNGSGGSGLIVPNHRKFTTYKYNAQNKVTEVSTPDAGTTTNYYDLVGRVVLLQNAKQKSQNRCTYFVYDNLSRVIETGAVPMLTKWDRKYFADVNNSFYSDLKISNRTEVTATLYDTASYTALGAFINLPAQSNLKNRVSCTKYFEAIISGIDASKDTTYVNALHYSYDISGNVKTLINDLRTAGDQVLRFKRVDYEYDLYSGKVLMVSYNRGFADQFYQKYAYDSDNRIIEVKTSKNGVYWDRDASYQYYDHGPLARTELGENRVQGIDYAYTINGWLKAINGVQNNAVNDMGSDGAALYVTPKDVFSQRIDYFNGDYKAIGDSNTFRELPAASKSLYNGNIAAIATALAPFNNIYNKYHYDPLQRIDRAEYDSYTINNTTTPRSGSTSALNAYRSYYKYDRDGNLQELYRMGTNKYMDSLRYNYTFGTNKLKSIADFVATADYKIDIPHTLDTSITRYTYDANGNMTSDLISGLRSITWTNAGKVKSIEKMDSDSTKIYFTYDALGNRLTKEVVKYPTADSMVTMNTTYVRDASGNILAVYEGKKEYDLGGLVYVKLPSAPYLMTVNGAGSSPLSIALADALHEKYINNPLNNLAKLAMVIPGMNQHAYNGGMMQNLVSSLDKSVALEFVKTNTAITGYTLSAPDGIPVNATKLSAYLQPVLLSESMDSLQKDLLLALKNNNEPLYFNTLMPVDVTMTAKNNFPADMTVLSEFKSMPLGDKLSIANNLAAALTGEATSTLPMVVDVLKTAYSTANTNTGFVTELPSADIILDEIKQDAVNYITYRYGLVDAQVVPLDTVAAEFITNGVLLSVLADTAVEPTPEALAVIINQNFPSVVSLAGSKGQGSLLADALKSTIIINGNLPDIAYPPKWLKGMNILKSQHQSLAEHHIYGSSRLGLQKYLPQETQYDFIADTPGGTVNTLTTTKPWYSIYGNDLFHTKVYDNDLRTGTINSDDMGITSHLLGNRHYELTNHLGNVQATVLDRTSPRLRVSDSALLGYKADISTAQDYYPFGMLMPDRYISDTNRKCVTVNTTVLVPVLVKVYPTMVTAPMPQQLGSGTTTPIHKLPKSFNFANTGPYIYHYNPASSHPNSTIVSGALVNNMAQWDISLSDEPSGGVSAYVHIEPDTTNEVQEVGFDLELPANVYVDMRVRQYVDTGEEYVNAVSWTSISESGPYHFALPVNKAYVKAGGPTILEMTFRTFGSVNIGTGVTTKWNNYYTYISHYVSQTHIATICEEKDNYRFGFNGMEKDNEPKGIGNSLDFGARIYDSRTGRWLSRDPLEGKYPALSPYNFTGNNPIMFIDPDGKKIVVYDKGKAYMYTPGARLPDNAPEVLRKVDQAAKYAMQTKTGARIWSTVANSDKVVNIHFKDATIQDLNTNRFRPIVEGRKDGDLNLGNLDWDYNSRIKVKGGLETMEGKSVLSGYQSPSTVLTHELGHVSNMIKALDKGVNSKEWIEYKTTTNEDMGYDAEYDTQEERMNTELNETPYINEINEIEGKGGSYQRPRKNHEAEIEYRDNSADVNKNPSKSEQQKEFNAPY